jgi:hypothetical protein
MFYVYFIEILIPKQNNNNREGPLSLAHLMKKNKKLITLFMERK